MKVFTKRFWLLFFLMLFAFVMGVVASVALMCNHVYEAEEEFVYWHDAEVTNRLSEIDSGMRDYMGPTAQFIFEEKLKIYSPTCMVDLVASRFREDHPEIVCAESKIGELLSSAEYFNNGTIVPRVHVIVRSEDALLAAAVTETFVNVVADAVEEDAVSMQLKAVEQIQKRLSRLQDKRNSLAAASKSVTGASDEVELRRIDKSIEGLKADIERVKSPSRYAKPRVFRIRRF